MDQFSNMAVGDRVKMPAVKWGGENRQFYEQAAGYTRATGAQFEVSGNDDGNGYWLERIR